MGKDKKELLGDYLAVELDKLRYITDGCRPDMHEPDEQGITAEVFGDHLDNACGEMLDSGEFVVELKRARPGKAPEFAHFNLATLIALARRAGF